MGKAAAEVHSIHQHQFKWLAQGVVTAGKGGWHANHGTEPSGHRRACLLHEWQLLVLVVLLLVLFKFAYISP